MRADDQRRAHGSHDGLCPLAIQRNMAAQGECRDSNAEQEQTTDSSMPVAVARNEIRQAERQRSAEKERFKLFRYSDQAGESGDRQNQRSSNAVYKAGSAENDSSSVVQVSWSSPFMKHV